jgi:predicted nucleic acid-binding protein
MLVDANLLLFAADKESPHYPRASRWLNDQLSGERRVGIPWQSLGALAIEHGIEVCSADTDFARFTEIAWQNPVADPTA